MSNDIKVSKEFLKRVEDALSINPTSAHGLAVRKELENILGGWKPFSEMFPANSEALIELKSGSSTLLAFQVRAPGKSARLAYVSMQESGIDWVDPEDVDGWREYKYEES
jgi:hypothetical protein